MGFRNKIIKNDRNNGVGIYTCHDISLFFGPKENGEAYGLFEVTEVDGTVCSADYTPGIGDI